MPLSRTFTVQANIYETNEEGRVLRNGKPVIKRNIGTFSFRKPTVKDERDIGVAKSIALQGQRDEVIICPQCRKPSRYNMVDNSTNWLVEILARLPILCVSKPANFDWDGVEDMDELAAVWEAFLEGSMPPKPEPVVAEAEAPAPDKEPTPVQGPPVRDEPEKPRVAVEEQSEDATYSRQYKKR